MRSPLLGLSIVAIVAASALASSAFNYADLTPRTVIANIVTDDNAYLAVALGDADYSCFVSYTSGVIDVTWDNGGGAGACSDLGTGVNPDAVYYFHDVLKITNKGSKSITKIWLNMTDETDPVKIETASAANTMVTGEAGAAYAFKKEISNLAVGSSYYVGFRIDTSGLASGTSISTALSIEARNTA